MRFTRDGLLTAVIVVLALFLGSQVVQLIPSPEEQFGRPFEHHAGVAEPPRYRILPDRPLAVSSTDTWQSYEGGGPLGWIETGQRARTIPSYMVDDWNRDWGSIEAYTPLGTYQRTPVRPAEVTTDTQSRWGWWRPEGPIFVTNPR